MSLLGRLWRSVFGGSIKPRQPVFMRAKYDAAQTTEENAAHWANSDALSARAANSLDVRQKLRNRARYEAENNSYCKGVLQTVAHDLIGTGPRLQLAIPGVDPEVVRQTEHCFARWAEAIQLADKLRIFEETRRRDGEAFAVFATNPRIADACSLDVRLIECDQVTTPDLAFDDPYLIDGIRLDISGNPVEYHVLKAHPGDTFFLLSKLWEYDRVPANQVLHWYRVTRPGQARGIPEITPALPLFALLRRYTLAVIGAAEVAANIAGVLKTDVAADSAGGGKFETFDRVEFGRNLLLTLPANWDAMQFDAKQPTAAYSQCKLEILSEIGRCLNVPINVMTADSSRHSFSSGKLDHLVYHRSLRVDRKRLESQILGRILRAYLDESLLIPGYLPAGLPPYATWSWSWFWDGFDSIEPEKDAKTQEILLRLNVTTLAEIYSEYGQDWETHVRQRAREIKLLEELGISESQAAPQPPFSSPAEGQTQPETLQEVRHGD